MNSFVASLHSSLKKFQNNEDVVFSLENVTLFRCNQDGDAVSKQYEGLMDEISTSRISLDCRWRTNENTSRISLDVVRFVAR